VDLSGNSAGSLLDGDAEFRAVHPNPSKSGPALALVEPADSTLETERPPKPRRARKRKPRASDLPAPTHCVLMTVDLSCGGFTTVTVWRFAATSAEDADRKFRETIPERYQAQCRVVKL